MCGHSTGGAIALQLAIRHPDVVAGLVLVDTGAHMRGHGDVDATLERIRTGWGEELRGLSPPSWCTDGMTGPGRPSRATR